MEQGRHRGEAQGSPGKLLAELVPELRGELWGGGMRSSPSGTWSAGTPPAALGEERRWRSSSATLLMWPSIAVLLESSVPTAE